MTQPTMTNQSNLITIDEYRRACLALEDLRRILATEMRGRMVPSAKAQKLMGRIDGLRRFIAAYERQEREQLNILNLSFDSIREIIAIPLIADVLNDLVTGVNAALRNHGCAETTFAEKSNKLLKLALEIVDALAFAEEGLPRMIEHNDTLVDAIRKKVFSYIDQRLPARDKLKQS